MVGSDSPVDEGGVSDGAADCSNLVRSLFALCTLGEPSSPGPLAAAAASSENEITLVADASSVLSVEPPLRSSNKLILCGVGGEWGALPLLSPSARAARVGERDE